MATYCPEDVSSRELSCPICFEDYDIHNKDRAPRLLLCLHTFCHDCTRKLWRADGTLECSLCRMVHEQVSLDDLFDNHVIVQYLRQESEQKDLEIARRLDEDYRQGEMTTNTPAIVNADESEDSVDQPIDTSDIDEQQAVVNEELPLAPVNNYASDSSDSLFRNFLDELMENFGSRQDAVADDLFNQDNEEEEEDDEEEEEAGEDMPEEMEPEELQEDSSDCTANVANPSFSLSNIQALFGQLDEVQSSDSEEQSSDGEPVTNMSSIVNFIAMINRAHETDNEEDEVEEEEEDEEERWHSASDEFQTPLWAEEDTVELEDTSEGDEWQIITQESFFGE